MSRATYVSGRLPTPTSQRIHPQHRSGGFTRAILTVLIAAHSGMAASRRYEDLRRQGLPPAQAVSRALAETGDAA